MRAHPRSRPFTVPGRMGLVNITADVEREVRASGVAEGLCLVNAMHITASVFINDDEPGLHEDYKRWLEWLAPFDASPQRYHHNRTGEDNGDAHHKRQIMGREVVVAITAGKLDFGPWEQIFYGEFDGRRDKRVLVKGNGELSSCRAPIGSPQADGSRPRPRTATGLPRSGKFGNMDQSMNGDHQLRRRGIDAGGRPC